MPPKIFSRLRSLSHRLEPEVSAPDYSTAIPQDSASPPYEEQDPNLAMRQARRRPNLQRTTSDSSYSSTEILSWVEDNDEDQQRQGEELPPYEEKPKRPSMSLHSPSSISVGSISRSRTHSLCPCAQCHSLR